jgi:hypothetical protein
MTDKVIKIESPERELRERLEEAESVLRMVYAFKTWKLVSTVINNELLFKDCSLYTQVEKYFNKYKKENEESFLEEKPYL